MSLNWREIDLILEELDLPGSFIQQVIQPDFRNLYLEVFRPGRTMYVRICLETGRTRIHSSRRAPAKPRIRQRFAQFLHARLKGGHIVSARQVNADRIVRIDVERAGEQTILWARLWGGASNLIATATDGTILDSFFRRPARGEASGGNWIVVDEPRDPREDEKLNRFVSRWETNVDASARDWYDAEEDRERRERAVARARSVLENERAAALRRLAEIDRRTADIADADRFQTYGDLIISNVYRIKPGAHWLDAEDYTHDNAPIRIELDPTRSAAENAGRAYDRARRTRRQLEALNEERSLLSSRVAGADEALVALDGTPTEELKAIAGARETRGTRGIADDDMPGLRFESHGFTILVGRNARENDELLRRHVRGNDIWLHARDYPGGYVFVKSKRNKSVPLDVLLDAGTLAIHYSKAKPNGRADLYYTHVKYLRRAKDGPRGLVLPTQEKNLHVVTETDRLSRLLGTRAS